MSNASSAQIKIELETVKLKMPKFLGARSLDANVVVEVVGLRVEVVGVRRGGVADCCNAGAPTACMTSPCRTQGCNKTRADGCVRLLAGR